MDVSSDDEDKQVTQISGNKLSASFNTGRFKGKITGAIDDSGQLKALISVVKTMGESGGGSQSPGHIKLKAQYDQDGFETKAGAWIPLGVTSETYKEFKLILTRAPGSS